MDISGQNTLLGTLSTLHTGQPKMGI